MEEKIILIETTNNSHVEKDGVVSVKSDRLIPVRGMDGRMVLRYYFDCAITVPQGTIGFIVPPNNTSIMSLTQVGQFLLMPGRNAEPCIEYKLNTDAIPAVYEKDDFCASIVFLPIGLNGNAGRIKTEIVKPAEETTAPKQGKEQADVNPTDQVQEVSEETISGSLTQEEAPVLEQ